MSCFNRTARVIIAAFYLSLVSAIPIDLSFAGQRTPGGVEEEQQGQEASVRFEKGVKYKAYRTHEGRVVWVPDYTIPQAVEVHGDYVVGNVTDRRQPGLGELIEASSHILRGRITASRSELTPNQRGIISYYDIEVLELLGGNFVGERIVASAPGGTLRFPNGEARIAAGFSKFPEVGQTYILFLEGPRQEDGVYPIVFGSQGAFQFLAGKVLPLALENDRMFKDWFGTEIGRFEREVSRRSRRP